MKNSKKLKRLENAFRNNFNAVPEIAVSQGWQSELLERLKQLPAFNITPEEALAKFEEEIWRLIWVSFAVSAIAAIVLAFYVKFQPDDIEHNMRSTIYSNITNVDQ